MYRSLSGSDSVNTVCNLTSGSSYCAQPWSLLFGMQSCTMFYPMELTFVLLLAVSLLSQSVQADLKVQIVKEDVNIYRDINESLTLNCTATTDDGQPIESISWTKDSKAINSTLFSNNWAVKIITNISRSDAGYYKCVARYKGREEKDAVFLNVKGKPIIFKSGEPELFSHEPYLTFVGDPILELRCHATGSKIINYSWLKNGSEIMRKEGFISFPRAINGKTLRMVPVARDMKGKYTCEARNHYGKDSYSINVIVSDRHHLPPTITAERSMISSYIGQANKIVCTGENVRKIYADTAWYFNGKEITKEQIENSSRLHAEAVYGFKNKLRMSLVINQTSLQDAGNYTCQLIINQDTYNQTTLLVIKRKAKEGTKEEMLTTKEIIGLVLGIIVLLIVVILILMLYLTKKRKKMNCPEIPKGPFKYGAFITYNSQDFNWVETNLLPLLETNGIEICIHYRNFEPGVPIHENMVNSVYRSRVVIVVMSNNYMKSKYCRTELDYAVHRALEEHGTNPLIILRIDPEIKRNRLPKEIKNKTFLDFTSNVEKATWENRLLKYIKWDGDDKDVNENVKEDEEEEECVALIEQDNVETV